MSEEYTGGSVSYYTVEVKNPTNPDLSPYKAECNDIIEALGMNYAEGNALKALWRRAAARNLGMSKKGYEDGLYDAEKVVFFGQRLVAQESALKAEALSEQDMNVMDAKTALDMIDNPSEPNDKLKAILRLDSGKPDWNDAPEWAGWLGYDGEWAWFEHKPIIREGILLANEARFRSTKIEQSFGYSIHYMEHRPQ